MRKSVLLAVWAIALAPLAASAAPMVTFYDLETSRTDSDHTGTITVDAHADATVIIAAAVEGGSAFTPANVSFGGTALAGQVGGNEESGRSWLMWGSVGDIAAGDVTVSFTAGDKDLTSGMWIIEDFITTPSATAFAAWDDSVSTGGDPTSFALNPTEATQGTLEAGTSDQMAFNAGDYVFALMYNGSDTEIYDGLRGALTNNRGIEADGNSYGLLYADGVATAASQEAGFNSTDGWYRVSMPAVAFTPVPEPATLSLLGLGLLATVRRRR